MVERENKSKEKKWLNIIKLLIEKLLQEYNSSLVSDTKLLKSALSLYVLYEDLTFSEIIQNIKTSPTDLVSSVGGTMGININSIIHGFILILFY